MNSVNYYNSHSNNSNNSKLINSSQLGESQMAEKSRKNISPSPINYKSLKIYGDKIISINKNKERIISSKLPGLNKK